MSLRPANPDRASPTLRVARPPADGPCRTPRPPTARPYGNPDPEWLGIDWREHLRTGPTSTAPQVNYVELGGGDPALAVRPRALGLLAELAREHPPLLPHPPRGRARPARLRRLADAALGDHDRGLRAAAHRLLRRARHRATASLVGNSMGGFVAAEAAITRARAGSTSSCWSRPRGSRMRAMRKEPGGGVARDGGRHGPARPRRPGARAAAPRACATLAFRQVFRWPLRAAPRAAVGAVRPRRREARASCPPSAAWSATTSSTGSRRSSSRR